jgi:hypothetical protein
MSISCIEAWCSRPQKPQSANSVLPASAAASCRAALFLAGLGADEVIADRDTLAIGQQHEAHAPHEPTLGRAIAKARMAGELALGRAAGVAGACDQRAVGGTDPPSATNKSNPRSLNAWMTVRTCDSSVRAPSQRSAAPIFPSRTPARCSPAGAWTATWLSWRSLRPRALLQRELTGTNTPADASPPS